jgi:membrane-bound metal-dependent hydrolase YbcI (DUF457 family)
VADFNYFAHAIIGLISSIPVSHIQGDILLGMIGGIFPDIDHKKSILGRFNPFVSLMTHRGFSHTIAALLIFSIPFLYVNNFTFAVGYFSHLIADWLHSWGKWKIKLM